jgi:hypothetical protein
MLGGMKTGNFTAVQSKEIASTVFFNILLDSPVAGDSKMSFTTTKQG